MERSNEMMKKLLYLSSYLLYLKFCISKLYGKWRVKRSYNLGSLEAGECVLDSL